MAAEVREEGLTREKAGALADKFAVYFKMAELFHARVRYPEQLKDRVIQFAKNVGYSHYHISVAKEHLDSGSREILNLLRFQNIAPHAHTEIDLGEFEEVTRSGQRRLTTGKEVIRIVREHYVARKRYEWLITLRANLMREIGAVWEDQHGFQYCHREIPVFKTPYGDTHCTLSDIFRKFFPLQESEISQLSDDKHSVPNQGDLFLSEELSAAELRDLIAHARKRQEEQRRKLQLL